MPPTRFFWILVAAGISLAPSPASPGGDTGPTDVLPLSSITSAQGDRLDLDAFRGRVVYLDFWASWCPPCRRSFPWLARMHESYGDRGLVVIAVNLDRDRAKAERFLQRMQPPFRVVFDPEAVLARSQRLDAMPSAFIFLRDGELGYSHAGFRDRDRSALEDAIVAALEEKTAHGEKEAIR